MNTGRLISLVLSLVNVAGGGALVALAAYLTSHSADQPALYAALLLAVRELDKWRSSRDASRGSSVGSSSSSSSPPAVSSVAAAAAASGDTAAAHSPLMLSQAEIAGQPVASPGYTPPPPAPVWRA